MAILHSIKMDIVNLPIHGQSYYHVAKHLYGTCPISRQFIQLSSLFEPPWGIQMGKNSSSANDFPGDCYAMYSATGVYLAYKRSASHKASQAILHNSLTASDAEWSQWDSNPRPLACHASALPAELWPQTIFLLFSIYYFYLSFTF